MASRRKSGLGTNLRELLGEDIELIGSVGPSSMTSDTGVSAPLAESPATRTRARPGIGQPGLERIRQELDEFRVSETPPEEPPTGGGEEDYSYALPPPEYISPITQSVKRPGFGSVRPDLYPEFYGGGPQSSTRVHAIQWIPVFKGKTDSPSEIYGDILVAFARPSSSERSRSTGSLYVYHHKTQAIWDAFKGSTSLGRAVRSELGSGSPYDSDYNDYYRKFHPDYSGLYIFDEVAKWRAIRPNNEISGPTRTKISEDTFEKMDVESIFFD